MNCLDGDDEANVHFQVAWCHKSYLPYVVCVAKRYFPSLAIRFSIAISSVLIQIQENRKGRGVICAVGEASVELRRNQKYEQPSSYPFVICFCSADN